MKEKIYNKEMGFSQGRYLSRKRNLFIDIPSDNIIRSLNEWTSTLEKFKDYPLNFIYRIHIFDENFIRKYWKEINFDWELCSLYQPNLSEDFIEEFFDKLHMEYICNHYQLTENFIRKNKDRLYWDKLSFSQNFSISFIEEMEQYICWKELSMHCFLTEEIIEKYKDRLDWDMLCCRQRMSEDFMEKMSEYLNWAYLSRYQILSFEFIKKYIDKLDLDLVLKFQVLYESEKEYIENYK